jgi:hypothetical protein
MPVGLNLPKSSWNNTAEYQVSGTPFVTGSAALEVPVKGGSALEVRFSHVTQWVKVQNTGPAVLRVGFSALGVKDATAGETYSRSGTGKKYFTVEAMVSGSGPLHIDARCTSIYLLSDHSSTKTSFEVMAGLTTVNYSEFPALTGSDGLWGIG